VKLTVPGGSLVLLVGPSGAGKSTFAKKYFKPTEILSSDYCRALVADDEGDQSASRDAFEVLHLIAGKRLQRGRLTVIDATNVQANWRASLLALAREHGAPAVAIVFNLGTSLCLDRNRSRVDRQVSASIIEKQEEDLQRSLTELGTEGFRHLYVLTSADEMDDVEIELQPLGSQA
jgi:protein phosphatase